MASLVRLSSPRSALQKALARSYTAGPAHEPEPNTHFKITLRRSAIALGERKKETLTALGLHRRMQTVYHEHTPEAAGKILKVKELVEVENVPATAVRTQSEQRWERRAPRGYSIGGSRLRGFP
jgi:large subunit ribosomal protein L30